MKKLLLLFILLVAWKIVRTDWVVVWPWVSHNMSPWSRSGPFEVTYRPPVSPMWRVPQPSHKGREYSTWERAIPTEGSHVEGPTGPAHIRPDWLLIVLKISFPMMVMASPAIMRALHHRRWLVGAGGRLVTGYLKELVAESKRQHGVANSRNRSARPANHRLS